MNDKCLHLLLPKLYFSLLIYSHSAKTITKSIYQLDCPIPSVMNVRTKRAALEIDSISGKQTLDTRPKKLTFDVEGKIGDCIYFAETALGDAVSADDTFVLEFKNFGKNFIVSNNLR